MNLDEAIELLKVAVKPTGTNEEKHIDLGLVPNQDKAKYQKALAVSQLAIREGKITKDEFNKRVNLDG